MSSRIADYWDNAGELPRYLSIACRLAMLIGPVLLVALFIPGIPWNVNGQLFSYGELWSSGAGLTLAIFAALISVGAWGVGAKKRWARWAWISTQIVPLLTLPKALMLDLPLTLFSSVVGVLIVYVCLFRIRSVREYFSSGGQSSA